jgi:(S)-ureidoglycine aminohydrolase
MKAILLAAALQLTIAFGICAQKDTLPARVFILSQLPVITDSSRQRVQIMDGSTILLSNLEAHLTILKPGQAAHPPHTHTNTEELIIVKQGLLKVTIRGQSKLLSAGGLALSLPGDEHGAINAGTGIASYYIIKYTQPAINPERGQSAGGFVLMDWTEPAVMSTDKGERRQFFNKPTALFDKFDMHVTTLKEGEVSHPPHTHLQEEIIIVKTGTVSMQIAGKFYPAAAGDFIFLSSGIPHALQNAGREATTYFAFQWQ